MDIRGQREVTLPMIVAVGGDGREEGWTVVVDWGRGEGQSCVL